MVKEKTFKISFEISPLEAYRGMMDLLRMIQSMGNLGASRIIGVKDEDGWKSFLFDGDGCHRIENIKGDENG